MPSPFETGLDDRVAFLGRGLSWPLREDPSTGDFRQAEGATSVSESVQHLVRINLGEIPGFEGMGAEGDRLLFHNQAVALSNLFHQRLKDSMLVHETRAQLISVQPEVFQVQNTSKLGLNLRVKYRIKTSGEVVTDVYPFNQTIDPGAFE